LEEKSRKHTLDRPANIDHLFILIRLEVLSACLAMLSLSVVLVAYVGTRISGDDVVGGVMLGDCTELGERWCQPTQRCVDEWMWKECTNKKSPWADMEQEM
jgi:hypothetical protein